MSIATILDVNKICRVCLRSELHMECIFSYQTNNTVAQMLSELTTHNIQRFDGLPDLICGDCLHLLLNAYKLKEQFERSNNILIGIIDNGNNVARSKLAFVSNKNALEKSTQTDYPFVGSCEYSNKKTSSEVHVLEELCKSSENRRADVAEVKSLFDDIDKSNLTLLYSDEHLSEQLLILQDADNAQNLMDDKDELTLSMLTDSTEVIEDITCEILEESQNFVDAGFSDNQLKTTKRTRENKLNLSQKETCVKYNKNTLVEHSNKDTTNGNNKIKNTNNIAKSLNCSKCSKNFCTRDLLLQHIENHDKKRFVCRECYKEFLTKEELHTHGKEQGHDKPLLCTACGLRCKSSDILTVHIRRHNGEKPFKCKFCSKGFPRMGDLKIHEKYHTGEKSHFCEICGKGFFRKYNLRIHFRVHTGEKPYKCSHCTQAFAQSNDLKAHTRRHTGERFRCEVCNAAFLQGYQIRQHKLQQHGIHELPPTQRLQKFITVEN